MSERIFENYDDLHQSFKGMKESNSEMLMFFSVLAKLVSTSQDNLIDNLEKEEDKLITKLLVDYSQGDKMNLLKQKLIMNDVVSQYPNPLTFLEEKTEGQ